MMDLGPDMAPVQMAGLGLDPKRDHRQMMSMMPGSNLEMIFDQDMNYGCHSSSSMSMSSEPGRVGGVKRPRERKHGLSQSAKERRTRTIFNYAQLNALERIFIDVEYPDGDLKAKIAQRLDVDEGTIQIWFQNRRAKKKRLERGQPSESDGPQHMQPVSSQGLHLPMSYPHGNQYHQQHHPPPHHHSIPVSASSVLDGYSPFQHQQAHHHSEQGPQNFTLPIPVSHHEQQHDMGFMALRPPYNLSPGPPLRDLINRDLSHHVPQSSCLPSTDNVTLEHSSKHPVTSSNQDTSSIAAGLASPRDDGDGLVNKIKKWPVKESPTSQSAFGKLDFPRLPRVCIRHDTPQGRTLADRRKDRTGGDMLKLRLKILKSDPPKSPPPNQTCAAIPRSQRNELELALIKHGLADEPVSDGGSIGRSGSRLGDFRSDELSSSSESSDSEGLAPPRRRRKVVREKKSLPPNRNCTTVPLSDRTLPFLDKVQYHDSPTPRDDSDWDTSSDESSWSWADFDTVKNKGGTENGTIASAVSSENKKPEPSKTEPPEALGIGGPRSAPAAFEEGDIQETGNSSVSKSEKLLTNPADSNDDDASEMALAREFAEMLPSPFGVFLPVLREQTDASNGSHLNRRPRIHSDSVVFSSSNGQRDIPVSESNVGPLSDCFKMSPSSIRSTESPLSGLSTLLGLPVSPNELVKSLSDAQLEPAIPCDMSVSEELAMPKQPSVDFQTHDQGTLHSITQPSAMKQMYGHHEESKMPVMAGAFTHPVGVGFNSGTGNNFTNVVPPSGVIRPIPTHPLQDIPRSVEPSYSVSNMQGGSGNAMFYGQAFQTSENNHNVPYSQSQTFHPEAHSQQGSEVHGLPNAMSFPYHHNDTPPNAQASSVRENYPASVVHHQPTSGPFQRPPGSRYQRQPQFAQHGGAIGVNPSPTGHSAACQAASRVQSPVGVSVSPSPDVNGSLPPNQVCTAVPDAVSSEGLMARYLAWTQGRVVQR